MSYNSGVLLNYGRVDTMPQFHETLYGKRFLKGQLPQLLKHLETIATELKRSNDLKEKELKQKGVE
ncbi:hypothetical protein ACMG4J_02495 [Rossellomorea marisflavi]|uniref:hypothetical protein n=1 Tax=Rossellomorea marisflavi TaxID=189381 RepID=UPI0039BF135A